MEQLGYKIKEFKAWPEAFFHCRKLRNFSITDISRRVGVSRKTVQDWEDGLAYPTKGNVSVRLYGIMNALKSYKSLLPKELQDVEPAEGVNKTPLRLTVMGAAIEKADAAAAEAEALAAEAAEPAPARPHRFGEAITLAREDAGLSKREVGELVGVSASSISNWELGVAIPIVEHWNKLISLFPELKLWDPSSKDIGKPGREPGAWSGGKPVLKPDPPRVVPAAPTLNIGDVATAYAKARVKEAEAKAAVARFEEKILELEMAKEAASKAVADATAEADEAHRQLLEMAAR